LLLGEAGAGKSLIANFLIDGRDSGRFLSSNFVGPSVTKDVQVFEWHEFGNINESMIRVIDVPGIGASGENNNALI